MAKHDLSIQLEMQTLKKENVSLKNKLSRNKANEEELLDKIKKLEAGFKNDTNNSNTINLSQIKLTSNIRDAYEYEEIENLALDILQHGQLQPVLLTADFYLLFGYRRYHAIQLLNSENYTLPSEFKEAKVPDYLKFIQIEQNLSDLNKDLIIDIQFSENNERRSIDNFQLGELFLSYQKRGFTQKQIADKFKKSKGDVSCYLKLHNIHPELKKFLKEFQVYAWSQKKFVMTNSDEMSDEQLKFYNSNKGIIGIRNLYNIAKEESLDAQKKAFIKIFGNRLSDSELEEFSEYRKGILSNSERFESIQKDIRSLFRSVNKLDELPEEKRKYLSQINSNLEKIEKLINRIID